MVWTTRAPRNQAKLTNGTYLSDEDRGYIFQYDSYSMNFRLATMSRKFPFINEMSEIKNTYFDSTKALRRLPQKSPFGRLYFNELDRYILGDMCIDSPNNTWNFDDVTVVKCQHKSWSDRYGLSMLAVVDLQKPSSQSGPFGVSLSTTWCNSQNYFKRG